MERVTCPSCSGNGHTDAVSSDVSNVDYFQCEICRTVSLAPKEGGPRPWSMCSPLRIGPPGA